MVWKNTVLALLTFDAWPTKLGEGSSAIKVFVFEREFCSVYVLAFTLSFPTGAFARFLGHIFRLTLAPPLVVKWCVDESGHDTCAEDVCGCGSVSVSILPCLLLLWTSPRTTRPSEWHRRCFSS